MLFRKSQPQPIPNPYDQQFRSLYNELWDAYRTLETRTKEAYILSQSLAVYPDGPDKALAQKQLSDKQHSVLCAIGHYDTVQAELKQFKSAHYNALDETKTWGTGINSHEIINQTIKHILKGELN